MSLMQIAYALAWLAAMVYLGNDALEHHREGRKGNVIAGLVAMVIVSGLAFMALFWWVFLW